MNRTRFALMVVPCVALAVLAGCSQSTQSKGVVVQVRVVENGQPLKFLKDEEILVGFSEEVAAGQKGVGVMGELKPQDATATLSRSGNTGIPPGKYRISMSGQTGYGDAPDRWEKVFDAKKPPLIAEVGPEEGQSFTIDIARWTVTKS